MQHNIKYVRVMLSMHNTIPQNVNYSYDALTANVVSSFSCDENQCYTHRSDTPLFLCGVTSALSNRAVYENHVHIPYTCVCIVPCDHSHELSVTMHDRMSWNT